MRRWQKLLAGGAGTGTGVAAILAGVVWGLTYHPAQTQPEDVTCGEGPVSVLQPGQEIKVMSWNVQYFAGKNYVFFYDLLDGSGPDERPSTADIEATLDEVARVLADENPDVILLQEVDDGAARTDGRNQVDQLLSRLGDAYPCHASAFYWKARYVPHGRILGSVGLKVTTLSRTRIDSAVRHQLPLIPTDPLSQQFGLKRAVLEARLPVEGGKHLVVLNTHLDAFAQGTDTMQRQVAQVEGLLEGLSADGHPWLIGGDFNLLPSAGAYDRLGDAQRAYYSKPTELESLLERYPSVPSVEETDGPDPASWFTHFPNDPAVDAPDRTIDYVFASPDLIIGPHRVRQADTVRISDHLPLVLSITVP